MFGRTVTLVFVILVSSGRILAPSTRQFCSSPKI